MRRTLFAAACFVALAGQSASAEMIGGQFVPHELVSSIGATYRLIFVTSGSIDASSSNASSYDTFVSGQVAAPGSLLANSGGVGGWKAVLSTKSGDRVANTIIGSNTPPIYNTANALGEKVALSGANMLNGTALINPVLYDQHGTSSGSGLAWTGSGTTGLGFSPFLVGDSSVAIGDANSVSTTWLMLAPIARNFAVSFGTIPVPLGVYGMSGVLIVPVPEPATLVMWSLFAGVAGLVFWRKGRKTS